MSDKKFTVCLDEVTGTNEFIRIRANENAEYCVYKCYGEIGGETPRKMVLWGKAKTMGGAREIIRKKLKRLQTERRYKLRNK